MSPFPTVTIALLGWPLLMVAFAAFVPIRWVVMISVIGGNLFLPQAGMVLPGIPNYTKPLAAGLGAFLAAVIVATPRLLALRPRLIDLFVLVFILSPGISSLTNQLGEYDALAGVVNRFLVWGVPYWLGRTLFSDGPAMRDLAVGIVAGGMVYVPFCVWESVMSPQLHLQLYGFRPSGFNMTKRFGGWRPMVFMQHGLAVAGWMASAAVVAWMVWRAGVVRRICWVPMPIVAIGLVLVTISLRSTGAVVLLIVVIGAAEIVHLTRLRLILLALLLLPAGYIGLRVAGWEAESIHQFVLQRDEDRAGSLRVRLENDQRIVQRAMERPLFGWGGWGRWRVRDEFGRDITISDSWWAIVLGSTGVVGLVAAYGTLIGSTFVLIRQKTTRRIFEGASGAAWAVGLGIMIYVLDTLVNAMPNTSYMLAAGAMASFVLMPRRAAPRTVEPGPEGVPGELAADSGAGRPRPRTIDLR